MTVERAEVPGPVTWGRRSVLLFRGLANALSVALIVYLTYFFTMFFSKSAPKPAAIPEAARVAFKKSEERQAEDRKLLTTYGPLNPATGTLRIPIDRAMELIVAEKAQRPSTPAPAPAAEKVASPQPEPAGAAPKGDAIAAPVAVSAPARVGMAPAMMYRAVCMACHDTDGRGTIGRKAMPPIPDFTDPKWQLSRTDAELQHSVLEGKGQLMLPMKDKFALARIDAKEMVAFVRGFDHSRPAVAATPQPQPAASGPAPTAGASSATAAPSPSAAPPAVTNSSSSALALAMASPAPDAVASLFPPTSPAVAVPGLHPDPTPNPVTAANLRAAAELYTINCLVCHGPDGRGTNVRAAFPPIPDFTNREWQASHVNPQLAVSILEGKGALMPPWRGKVNPEQARDLVAYVRAFGPADLNITEALTSDFGNRFRELRKQWSALDEQVRSLPRP